jgi:hypothetical protein
MTTNIEHGDKDMNLENTVIRVASPSDFINSIGIKINSEDIAIVYRDNPEFSINSETDKEAIPKCKEVIKTIKELRGAAECAIVYSDAIDDKKEEKSKNSSTRKNGFK